MAGEGVVVEVPVIGCYVIQLVESLGVGQQRLIIPQNCPFVHFLICTEINMLSYLICAPL